MNSSDDIKLWKNITSSDMKILLLSIRNSDIRSIHLDIIEEILCELVNRYVNYSIELDRLGDYYLIFDDDMLLVHYTVHTSWEENGVFTRGITPARNYIRVDDIVMEYNRYVRDSQLTSILGKEDCN